MTPAATEQQLLLPAPSLPLKEVSPPKMLLGPPVCPLPVLSAQGREEPPPKPSTFSRRRFIPAATKTSFAHIWGFMGVNSTKQIQPQRERTLLHSQSAARARRQRIRDAREGLDSFPHRLPARSGLISSMERCKYFANKTLCPRCSPERRLSSEGDKDAERSIRGRDTPVFPWRRRQRSPLP